MKKIAFSCWKLTHLLLQRRHKITVDKSAPTFCNNTHKQSGGNTIAVCVCVLAFLCVPGNQSVFEAAKRRLHSGRWSFKPENVVLPWKRLLSEGPMNLSAFPFTFFFSLF